MRFDAKINGIDFSAAFNSVGYSVTYEKREGTNGGQTQDGTLIEDILCWKAVIGLPCIDLEETVLAALLQACKVKDISFEYYDPSEQKSRLINASVEIGEATFLLEDCDGIRVYTGMAVTMREK